MYLPGGGRPAPPVPAHLNTCDSADSRDSTVSLSDSVTRPSESQREPQTERRSFTVALWLRLASYGYLRGRPRRPCWMLLVHVRYYLVLFILVSHVTLALLCTSR